MRSAEVDAAGRAVEVGGAEHHEQRFAVALELRAHVGARGVLDGEVVEPELPLDLGEQRGVGLVEADPHEAIGQLERFADVGDGDLADATAARVRHAVDDGAHARPSGASGARRASARYAMGPVSAATTPAIVLVHPAVT